jgi:hypothetical protein
MSNSHGPPRPYRYAIQIGDFHIPEPAMNRVMIRSIRTVLLSAAMLAMPSCSEQSAETKPETVKKASFELGVPGGIDVATTTYTAKVVSVSMPTREVVLDLPDKTRETVECGPQVVNLDQIQAGDEVKVTLAEHVAVSMGSEFDLPDNSTGLVAVAPRGAQPGAIMARTKQVTATVVSIDAERHIAVLQYPDGKTRQIAVRPDVDLSKRHVGEKVVFRTTDLILIRVDKP